MLPHSLYHDFPTNTENNRLTQSYQKLCKLCPVYSEVYEFIKKNWTMSPKSGYLFCNNFIIYLIIIKMRKHGVETCQATELNS